MQRPAFSAFLPAVPQSSERALDATFRLRRIRCNLLDAQFAQRAPDLRFVLFSRLNE